MNGYLVISICITRSLTAGTVVGIFSVLLAAATIYKFLGSELLQSSSEQISNATDTKHEKHIVKSLLRTAVMTILGFIFLLVVPGLGAILYGEGLGSLALPVFIIYLAVMIFVFKVILDKTR